MPRKAFIMRLHAGQEAEYEKRHNEIWPELQQLLKECGVSNYSIFLDKASLKLFGVMDVADEAKLSSLPGLPIMKRWWAYMADIMDTNPDNSPVETALQEVFYLP